MGDLMVMAQKEPAKQISFELKEKMDKLMRDPKQLPEMINKINEVSQYYFKRLQVLNTTIEKFEAEFRAYKKVGKIDARKEADFAGQRREILKRTKEATNEFYSKIYGTAESYLKDDSQVAGIAGGVVIGMAAMVATAPYIAFPVMIVIGMADIYGAGVGGAYVGRSFQSTEFKKVYGELKEAGLVK
jgi:hypothetical protein